jgi:cyclophilin family peptidyl-prolyl cis-trans isomerase
MRFATRLATRLAPHRATSVAMIAALLAVSSLALAAGSSKTMPSMAEVLKASQPSDWRPLDPDNTLYLELPAGRVVIELAPAYAPNHVANIKALVREHYFDGLAIIRSQDNYVVQWGDPDEKRKPVTAKATLPEEFSAAIRPGAAFDALPDPDTYAPEVGFSQGFPVARDVAEGRTWLAHCYGMVGAGRDNASDSGGGTELYVVTGHAPRHLDRNVTLVGRVVQGITLLSTLPRGTAALGFYDKPEQRVPITAIRLAADVPAAQRDDLEVLRTDTPTFRAAVDGLRFRGGDWFKYSPGRVELCNVPVTVRRKPL